MHHSSLTLISQSSTSFSERDVVYAARSGTPDSRLRRNSRRGPQFGSGDFKKSSNFLGGSSGFSTLSNRDVAANGWERYYCVLHDGRFSHYSSEEQSLVSLLDDSSALASDNNLPLEQYRPDLSFPQDGSDLNARRVASRRLYQACNARRATSRKETISGKRNDSGGNNCWRNVLPNSLRYSLIFGSTPHLSDSLEV